MSEKNFYITTPIYYVNDSPHIGHAYTTLACDVMARFKRLDGYNVKFLTGTDEHGQKVDKAAKNANIDPQKFTDEVSQRFRNLVNTGDNLLNISNDDFIRTTEERHKKACMELWQKIKDNGHIYLDKYSGWYSVRDEAYYQESELIEGKAPTGAEVEWVEEESYFFDLSKWQQPLLDFYEKNPNFVTPKSRFNEVKSFVRGGKEFVAGALKDLSISRTTFDWGVAVPDHNKNVMPKEIKHVMPKEIKHVMYVWIDALTNYLTAIGFPDITNIEYQNFWENQNSNSPMHIVGKDILRFHAVYWPAFLMAADLPLPKKIVAHGWWTIEGEKMSKSLGNVISPKDLVDEYGLDQSRFFLMSEVPFGNDGNFSKDSLIANINSSLANNIGNLAQRTLSMIQKNCNACVPDNSNLQEEDKILINKSYNLIDSIRKDFDNTAFDLAIAKITTLAADANIYIDNMAPWKLRRENLERMNQVLYTLAETIRHIAIYLLPFIPDSANKLLDQLGIAPNKRSFSYIGAENALNSGDILPKPEGIFPRIETKESVKNAS